MSDLKLNTANGSITLKPENGTGNVDVEIPRSGFLGIGDLYDAAHSFSSNGYQKFSNGLILQWGQYNDVASPTITFPIAFPNYCASATVEQYWNNTGSKYAGRVRSKGTTSMAVHWGNNYVSGADIIWIAIGY